jgi:DivIVA domain-containing protein
LRERRRVPAAIRNVSFPVSVRGYDRRAVDIYVARVNRLIAELEATRSPEAAVRHALEQAEERTRGILQGARETAEGSPRPRGGKRTRSPLARKRRRRTSSLTQALKRTARKRRWTSRSRRQRPRRGEILAGSREEAEERLQRAQDEVGAVREKAEAWAREFFIDTEAVQEERRELLDDVRQIAARLQTAASSAAARLLPGEPSEPAEKGAPAPESEDEGENGAVIAPDALHEGNASPQRRDQTPSDEKREAATGPDRSAS